MNSFEEEEHLSVREMQGWLQEEIRDVTKALELRLKQATSLVTSYASGELTPEETTKALLDYDRRWGEVLFGTAAMPGMSDEAILQSIDRSREESSTDTSHVGRLTKALLSGAPASPKRRDS